MLRPLRQYIVDEAKPRCAGILFSWETGIAITILLAFIKLGRQNFTMYPKISDLTTGLIAYASIALGFCVAGLTISLTFPEPGFTKHLAKPQEKKPARNNYSDLLFVFSWTAIAHWIAVMVLFCVVLFTDGSAPLLPENHSTFRTYVVALIAALCAYCLCQFLITVITLSQVGNLYVEFLASKAKTEST